MLQREPVLIVGERDKTDPCELKMDNVLIRRVGKPNFIRFYERSMVEVSRLTLDGFSIVANGRSLSIEQSIIGGQPPCEITLYPGVEWKADHNIYDISQLRVDKALYSEKNWDEYRKATKQDAASQLTKIVFKKPADGGVTSPRLPLDVGVDPKRLPKVEGVVQ